MKVPVFPSAGMRKSPVTAVLAAALLMSTTPAVLGQDFVVTFDDALVEAAAARAQAAAEGVEGGEVEIVGLNGGFELALVEASLQVFTDATGITVSYTGGPQVETRIETRVQAGDPPDIAQEGGLWNMQRYVENGLLLPIDEVIDRATLEADFPAGVLSGVTIDDRVYGVPIAVNTMMVWYNPAIYDGPNPPADWDELTEYVEAQVAEGASPWCMGMSSFSPATYFIENIFVKTYGAELLDAWAKGELPWTSDEVRDAFERYSSIIHGDGAVYGGVPGALSTGNAAAPGLLYDEQAGCTLFHWGAFTGGILSNNFPDLDPESDIDFFELPAVDPAFADHQQLSGWTVYAFNDRPQVRALLEYLASAEYQSLLANGGSWIMANQHVDVDVYPTAYMRSAAESLINSEAAAYGPMFQVNNRTLQTYLDGTAEFISDPSTLDFVLEDIQAQSTQ